MTHLDLMWPAIILVASIASAMLVRFAVAHGDRRCRARYKRVLERLRASFEHGNE